MTTRISQSHPLLKNKHLTISQHPVFFIYICFSMKKNTLFYLPVLLFLGCGNNEKNTKETAQDSASVHTDTVVDGTITEDLSPTPLSPHPLSDWGQHSHPFFDSPQVDALVDSKAVYHPNLEELMNYEHDHLNKAELDRLNTKQLIYYCLKYPCSFSQICSPNDFPDSTNTPKIQAYLPFDYSGAMRSEWQKQALQKKRDSVILVLNQFISQNPDKIESEYLNLLLGLKAVESIPTILKVANHNRYCYTYLVALMMDNQYAPFEKTGIYQELYGDESFQNGMRIEATRENIDLIKTLANEFYNTYKK